MVALSESAVQAMVTMLIKESAAIKTRCRCELCVRVHGLLHPEGIVDYGASVSAAELNIYKSHAETAT